MEGGFVTADCADCGQKAKTTLSYKEFLDLKLWVSCPKCLKQMKSCWVTKKEQNYGYECEQCQIDIWLSDLLPDWRQI